MFVEPLPIFFSSSDSIAPHVPTYSLQIEYHWFDYSGYLTPPQWRYTTDSMSHPGPQVYSIFSWCPCWVSLLRTTCVLWSFKCFPFWWLLIKFGLFWLRGWRRFSCFGIGFMITCTFSTQFVTRAQWLSFSVIKTKVIESWLVIEGWGFYPSGNCSYQSESPYLIKLRSRCSSCSYTNFRLGSFRFTGIK